MPNPDPHIPAVYFAREDGEGASSKRSEIFLHVSPLDGDELKFSIEPHPRGLPEPPWSGLYGAALKRDQIEHLHRQISAWLKVTEHLDQSPNKLGPSRTWQWQRGQ
jgi:hypothetical protein